MQPLLIVQDRYTLIAVKSRLDLVRQQILSYKQRMEPFMSRQGNSVWPGLHSTMDDLPPGPIKSTTQSSQHSPRQVLYFTFTST